MQCLQYTEVGTCHPYCQKCKCADLPLAAPASLDLWCTEGCHHCCDEGSCERCRKMVPNIAPSCASEQPWVPLKKYWVSTGSTWGYLSSKAWSSLIISTLLSVQGKTTRRIVLRARVPDLFSFCLWLFAAKLFAQIPKQRATNLFLQLVNRPFT